MDLLSLARLNLIITNVAWILIILLMGYLGAKRNPHIHLDIGILVSLVTAFILNRAMMLSLGEVISPSLVRRFFTGVIWGIVAGVGLGVVWGWGGGVSEAGLFLWLMLWLLIWCIGLAFAAQTMTYPFPMKRFGVGLSTLILLTEIALLYVVSRITFQ